MHTSEIFYLLYHIIASYIHGYLNIANFNKIFKILIEDVSVRIRVICSVHPMQELSRIQKKTVDLNPKDISLFKTFRILMLNCNIKEHRTGLKEADLPPSL